MKECPGASGVRPASLSIVTSAVSAEREVISSNASERENPPAVRMRDLVHESN